MAKPSVFRRIEDPVNFEELEAEIRSSQPKLAKILDQWRNEKERKLIWHFVSLAYDIGFRSGVNYGLKHYNEIIQVGLEKIFDGGKKANE